MRFCLRALILAAGLAAVGCSSSPSDPTGMTSIETTTSFGFCLGYCRATLTITPTELIYTEEAPRGDRPTVRRTAPLSATEWDELVRTVDRQSIERLPASVGCPDCADGGAESLQVIGDTWRKRVTFEFGATMPELQPLLARVRAFRGRFEPSR